jgi:uroporphyrin-3 C-methyltransferase
MLMSEKTATIAHSDDKTAESGASGAATVSMIPVEARQRDANEHNASSNDGNGDTATSAADPHTKPEPEAAAAVSEDPAPLQPYAVPNEAPRAARDPVASTLATAASIVALIAAGGGYYLWQELVKVQDLAGRAGGVNQAQLDTARQAAITYTDKTASDVRKELVETRAALETQVQDTRGSLGSQIQETRAQFDARLQEERALAEKQIRDNRAATDSSVTALRDELTAANSSLQGKVGELSQQIAQTQAASDKAIVQVQGAGEKAVAAVQSATDTAIADVKAGTEAALHEATAKIAGDINAVTNSVAEMKGAMTEMRQQMAERLANAEQAQTQLRSVVDESRQQLQQAVARNRLDWAVTELDHLLARANQQAQLERNFPRAVLTLRTAEQRIQALDDSALLPVREAVQGEIAALEGLSLPDVSGLALALARLANDASSLPLASDRQGTATPTSGAGTAAEQAAMTAWDMVRGFATAAWDRLRGVVVVRQDGEVAAPLLPPEQAYFLQQNLRLEVESARVALLRGDDGAFHASLENAIAWVNRYHDTKAAQTETFLAELTRINGTKLDISAPDTSRSLRALREVAPALASQ